MTQEHWANLKLAEVKREKIYVSDTMGFFGNKYEREKTREMETLTRVECEIMARIT